MNKNSKFKFNFSKVVKFDCTCGRRYINTDKCLQETDSRMPQTRADVIRAMNDEELAEFLEQFEVCSHCEYGDNERCTFENPCVHEFATAMALKWLQSEAEQQKGAICGPEKNPIKTMELQMMK